MQAKQVTLSFIVGGTDFYSKTCGEERTVLYITSEQFQKCDTANKEITFT